MTFMAPTDIDRDRLHSTANFFLPENWTEGVVEFRARLLDAYGDDRSSDSFTVLFEPKKVPTYWIVPINSGTSADPDLPRETYITESENYLKTIFPLHDVRFVRRTWRDIGALDRVVEGAYVNDVLDMLDDLWAAAFVAWMYSEMMDPHNSFECPEQIYGYLADGVAGMSRSVESGGSGASAVGTGGPNRDTHHGPRIQSQPWTATFPEAGAGTCATRTWTTTGNGAAMRTVVTRCGPGPTTPFRKPDSTRVFPWIDGLDHISDHGQPFTVMPAGSNEYPNLMSYCAAGFYVPEDMTSYYAKPTRWISTYRWEMLFDFFPAAEDDGAGSSPGSIRPMCYLSGTLYKNGKGVLDPVFVQPGLESKGVRPGDFRVEALDTKGRLLWSVPFHAEFDNEEQEFEKTSFRFQIPRKNGIAKIVLKKHQKVLDEIAVSKHAPKVEILSPSGGEVLKETGTLYWKAYDKDGDALRYVILYSPNKGKSWHPVKWGLEKEMYRVYSSDLPGGDEALFRVVATDGFNTVYADTKGTFVVPEKAPNAFITRPSTGNRFDSAELVTFEANAYDLEDNEIPATSCLWAVGGKFLGRGKKLTAQLPDGVHEIELTVFDKDENVVTERVTIAVGTDNLPKQLASMVKYN